MVKPITREDLFNKQSPNEKRQKNTDSVVRDILVSEAEAREQKMTRLRQERLNKQDQDTKKALAALMEKQTQNPKKRES